ncbi:MAG: DUF3990 domain-containing protein [Deltaproteobacteria bacterium]|nr:DUF3990 domain-containing protein [Deltaproteobacteria bacterium]
MKLFHGSNLEVVSPKIRPNLRALDFGAGFYLTSSEAQALGWAKTVRRRRGAGTPTVSIYTLQDEKLSALQVLRFETANGDWLDFVVRNRKEQPLEIAYDLVIGPVANDATIRVIDDYIDGVYTKEEAVRRLLPQNLTDQYAFLTEKALALLSFERSYAQ